MNRCYLQLAGWILGAILLSACAEEAAVEQSPPADPVVVYAAYADKTYLPTLFTEFTAQTGQIVLVRNGQVPGIVDDVIGNRVTPPADVLLTPSVVGAWRTAEEGELRPNYSESVANVSSALRDPDNFWVALSVRYAAIVYNADQVSADNLTGYEALALPEYRRKLCLTSAALPMNRAVIAQLMRKLGVRETELAVRSWVANLAQPVFASEEQLLAAIASGDCALGILSSSTSLPTGSSDLQTLVPGEAYADAEALGITRHARNPDGAAMLIDWLLQEEVQARHAQYRSAQAVTGDVVRGPALVHVATQHEDAARLAERARYR